jgi:transcriptional regulator with XRE-family HTH domain
VLPFCKIELRAKRPLPPSYPRELKSLGDHLRKRRLDLKLYQEDVARILGVDETTIYNWEKNRTSPPFRYIPKIVKFLGYSPFNFQTETLGERIIILRKLLGLSQEKLANRLGVDPGTLRSWERNKHQPLKRHLEKLASYFESINASTSL